MRKKYLKRDNTHASKVQAIKNLSNHSLGCLERWKFPCLIIKGLQYSFGELYWRTKPRGVRNDFFCKFLKTSIKLFKFNLISSIKSGKGVGGKKSAPPPFKSCVRSWLHKLYNTSFTFNKKLGMVLIHYKLNRRRRSSLCVITANTL